MEENENGQSGGFMEWLKEHPTIVVAVGIVAVLLIVGSYLRKQTGSATGGSASGSASGSGLSDQNGSPVVFVPTTTSFGTQTDYTASPVNSPGSTLTTGDLSNVAPGSSLTYSPTTTYAPAPTTTTTTTGLSGGDTATLVGSIGGTIASQTPTVTNTTTNSNNKNVGNTTNKNIGNTTVSGRHNKVSTHGSVGAPIMAPGTPTVNLHPANPNTLTGHRSAPVSHPAVGKTPTIHGTPILFSPPVMRPLSQKTPVTTGISTPQPITKFPVKPVHNTLLQSGV